MGSTPPRAFPPRLQDAEVAALHADADYLAWWVRGRDPLQLRLEMFCAAEDALRARPAPRKADPPPGP